MEEQYYIFQLGGGLSGFPPLLARFCSQSRTALLIASSANIEQCSLTGGKDNSLAISVFFIFAASHTLSPLIFSVTREDDAMAEPQPNVLKTTCWISPVSSLTMIWSFITSPHAGAPTIPVPTFGSVLGSDPTFRGFS